MSAADRFDAIVLAGGAGRRLHGADKPALLFGNRSLAAIAVSAVADATQVIVLGPPRAELSGQVSFVADAGTGPADAIAVGVAAVRAPLVVLLAADLPFVRRSDVQTLVQALREHRDRPAAVAVDNEGRRQFLLAVWRTDALRAALDGPDTATSTGSVDSAQAASGRSLRRLYPAAVVDVALPGDPPPWFDCDTPQAIDLARSWARIGLDQIQREPG